MDFITVDAATNIIIVIIIVGQQWKQKLAKNRNHSIAHLKHQQPMS